MNKLYKYNQIIISISGSLAVITLAIALIFISTEFIKTQLPQTDNNLLSNDSQSKLKAKNIRKQIITINRIASLDSTGEYSILPVTQINLKREEQSYLFRTTGMDRCIIAGTSYSIKSFSGPFNNVIIRYNISGELFYVFSNRINIADFYTLSIDSMYYLLLITQENDSNHDGILSSNDYSSLHMYNINNKLLKKIDTNINFIMDADFTVINSKPCVYILYGIDKDNDGKYNAETEPSSISILDLVNGKTIDFVDAQTLNQMQSIIDGNNK